MNKIKCKLVLFIISVGSLFSIGDNQNGTGQFNSGGLVVIGTFREDIMYGYKWLYVTLTHFWRPDQW